MIDDLLPHLSGGLIVSCQAYPGEPMDDPETLARVARAVVAGGAAGVRLQGIESILACSGIGVPVIGLWKDGEHEVYITPTLRHALAVADAGADVVAIDGTRRARPDGRTLAETVAELRRARPAIAIMADCGSLADALAAHEAGADLIGTTLAGYTGERPRSDGPDIDLVRQITRACDASVIAEGRYVRSGEVRAAREAGALAVCIGGAITHPASITRRIVAGSGLEG